ncbi:CHL4-domain-containing protein [Annulohypoxylon truncatum]|uniref:CHL4-domain-containing protein n=1 Tax=Annulohypoxylon truncatum TaxID=327061 RepID=UPI0020072AC5|nr:CHL4-domain-containing protein [Annulohypoxylon truncatum]KAI1206157.1 CHL4-domain-containing protein [Annulohypoxylon truncatum]
MARLSLPTTARLSSSLRVDPANNTVIKALNRLSRSSLLSLVLDWLDERNQSLCPPLLLRPDAPEDEDEDDFYPPAHSLPELRDLYESMQARKGGRREVVDRILEGDWRYGLSLYQLAMADLQYLYDHPGSLKWTAYRIQLLKTPDHEDDAEGPERPDKESLNVPRFHPSTFLQNLQGEVLPDVKAHYNFDRPKGMPLLLLRIFVIDSPYNTDLAVSTRHRGRPSNTGNPNSNSNTTTSFDASRTIYVAFPDASPHIFITKSASGSGGSGGGAAGEAKSLRALVVEGIPKALSRPRERYALKSTNLATKNLAAMLAHKGAGRTNAAAGGWGVYAGTATADIKADSPLQTLLPTPPLSDAASADAGEGEGERREEEEEEGGSRAKRRRMGDPAEEEDERQGKRARVAALARFGNAARIDDGKGVERLDVLIEDPFPTDVVSDDEDEADEDGAAVAARRKSKGRQSMLDMSLSQDLEDGDNGGGGGRGKEGDRGWAPQVRISLHGSHVFAGVRQLVEAGIVDGERMPGWLTGEEGVTIGAVRHGRIRGFRGSGI